MGQKHGGQRLLSESIGQLRHLDRRACVICGALRSRRCNQCSSCNSDTPLRELRVGDTSQDVARGGTSMDQQLLQSSQPVLPGEPLDDSPLPNCPIGNIVLTDRDKQLLSELRRVSAMALSRCVGLSIRHGMGREPRRIHERSSVHGLALPLQMPLAPR